MGRFMWNVCLTYVTICYVSSSIIPEDHDTELNEKVSAIVEHLLQEKQINGEVSDANLQQKVDHLEEKIKLMNARLVEQDKTVAGLKSLMMERIDDIGDILNSADDHRHNFSNIDEDVEVTKLIAPGRRVKRAVGNVAFSAYLTHTNSHTVVGQPIKFDQVLINDGKGYNAYTGAFTAPFSGVYLFNFAIDTRKLTFVRLVINGANQIDAVANVHTNAESRHSQSMGSNSAIVHVNQGESVLVETYEIPDAETASSNTFRLCTFSGVLLY